MLVWDATCPGTIILENGSEGGRCCCLISSHFSVPVTVEPLGVFGIEAHHFFKEVAWRMEIATHSSASGATHFSGNPKRECGGCTWVHGGDGAGLVGFNFSHVLCSSCFLFVFNLLSCLFITVV